ncbi:Outer membrane porin F precursor [Marinomonas spartinae]|uniref:OmpA family protein n=1 Tax=Marinomonas spartinae TaxID=1792290 RepID=UPI000808C550|nr:OmpA family protein [Marinomonas spartinae]SBS25616.1 Outer membrane porin F precursor [Marinomonas spartinae]
MAVIFLRLICIIAIGIGSIAYGDPLYGNRFNPQTLNDDDHDGVINQRDLCPNTPVGAKVDNNGCPIVTTSLLKLDLKVLFASGKYDVEPRFYQQIKRLADFLNKHPKSHVLIKGYTDSNGQAQNNLTLSEERASAISNVLINVFKISKDRVTAKGYGEADPIAPNDTPEGRAKNRRVIADVTADKTETESRWNIYSVDKSIQ